MKIFTSLFLAVVIFAGTAFAQGIVVPPVINPTLGDHLVARTFKTLARVYIATHSMKGLKKRGITRINKMTDEKFRKNYAKVYAVIRELPDKLKDTYGITENMTRAALIKGIEGLNKKTVYAMINAVPASMIARQFAVYRHKKRSEGAPQEVCRAGHVWTQITDDNNITIPD